MKQHWSLPELAEWTRWSLITRTRFRPLPPLVLRVKRGERGVRHLLTPLLNKMIRSLDL